MPVCADSVALVAREYARTLAPLGWEIHIAHLFCDGSDDHLPPAPHTTLSYLDLPQREDLGLRWRALGKLQELLRQQQWDLIICHRHKATELIAMLAWRQPLPPLISVVHGMRPLSRFVRWMRALQMRLLLQRRFLFVTVSHFIADELRRSGLVSPADRIEAVPNSLDIAGLQAAQLERDEARRQLGLAPDAFLFGTLGRLIRTKNHPLLLRAFARIARDCPDARLVLIGGGRLEQRLRLLAAEYEIIERVDFLGQVPAAARYLRALDAFLFASTGDAFGLAVIEAMAAELPVIAVAAGGVTEVVGERGRLLADDDATFAAAMLALYQAPADRRAELGQAGASHVLQHFSHSRLPQVLDELMAARPLP